MSTSSAHVPRGVPTPLRRTEPDYASAPLPAQLTSFVGREHEIDLVAALLLRPDIRLLTLTGPGGIGKTRLAVQVVPVVRDAFADGMGFVPLAAIRDPGLVLPTVAHGLDVPDSVDEPLIARLQTLLANRTLLLVLDNVEHLLDAAASLVAALLASCPRLTVVCTSRTRLAISGEQVVPLDALQPEAARRLFSDRARAQIPAFAITGETAPVVDAICARLDRLPLAIELAAARISVLPLRALLARLDHRLDLLTEGPRDAPPRLRDLREAIAWSHDLLTDEQQRLFRRLGVFIGGVTLEAAQAVAGAGGDVLPGVSGLVAANLVQPMDGVGDAPRFATLETIREYALEQLAISGEEAAIRRAHAEYYRWLAESALPHYDGPDLPIYNNRVDIELDNCRAAMTWTLDNAAAETGVRLAGALWRVWWYALASGGKPWWERVQEGRSWCERVLVMRDGLPVEAITEALTGAGFLALIQQHLEPVQSLGEELLARARAGGYAYGQWWALHLLGSLAEARDQDEEAALFFAEGRAIAHAVRNPENHASMSLVELGRIAQRAGDLERAVTHLDEAVALCRVSGNPSMLAQAVFYLGRVMREREELGQACALLKEALVVLMGQQDLGGAHAALVELSLVALRRGQTTSGVHLLAAADTFPSHLPYRRRFDDAVTTAQANLGTEAFAAAWDTGKHLPWDKVLTEVETLAAAAPGARIEPPPSPALPTSHGLTRREREVLRLLVEGHSNRAIGDTLSLSERTVENHVLHILTKLGLESRTAAATFAVRHGLA